MKMLSEKKIKELIREEFINFLKEDLLGKQISKNLQKMKDRKKKAAAKKKTPGSGIMAGAKAVGSGSKAIKRAVGGAMAGAAGPDQSGKLRKDSARRACQRIGKKRGYVTKLSGELDPNGKAPWYGYRCTITTEKLGAKKTRRRRRRRGSGGGKVCGKPGNSYGQQNFVPKDPKLKKGPDPEYDKFYADLGQFKLGGALGRRGKDYWWGPAHRRAYKKLLCAVEAKGKSLTPAAKAPDSPSKPGKPAKQPAAPPQPTVKIPEWAQKLGSQNIASPAGPDCPPQWSPARPARAVFLEKNEKEQWALYAKYPNQRPEWYPKWIKGVKSRMAKREKTLKDFAIRYLQVKSDGKLTLSDLKLDAMIRSTGTLQPDGMLKMKKVLTKMLQCEIKWFKMPEDAKKKALAAAKVKPAKPKPEPAPVPKSLEAPKSKPTEKTPGDEKNPLFAKDTPQVAEGSFEDAIMATVYGDKMRVTFLKDVTVKKMGITATPFKRGRTYSAAVYSDIAINHESVMGVEKSKMTKKKFLARVKAQGGDPCEIVDCNKSTITRRGKRVTFADFLKNPNV